LPADPLPASIGLPSLDLAAKSPSPRGFNFAQPQRAFLAACDGSANMRMAELPPSHCAGGAVAVQKEASGKE
jgi:hypothetical protein